MEGTDCQREQNTDRILSDSSGAITEAKERTRRSVLIAALLQNKQKLYSGAKRSR